MNVDFIKKLRVIEKKYKGRLRKQIEADINILFNKRVDSYKSLIDIFKNENEEEHIRKIACWVLGQLGYKKAVDPLLSVFRYNNGELGYEAIKSLGLIRDKKVVLPMIKELSRMRNIEKYKATIYAIGILGDKRAGDILLKIARDNRKDLGIRTFAIEGIANLMYKKALPVLRNFLNDKHVEIRFWAIYAMGIFGDKISLPLLKNIIKRDRSVCPGWWSLRKEAKDAIHTIERGIKHTQ